MVYKIGLPKDHPRACGENAADAAGETVSGGSPPRMRGKPHLARSPGIDCRITPAHAGKTLDKRAGLDMHEDHPRACGENASSLLRTGPMFGSPPRMRGKPRFLLMLFLHIRITPAHAGKTKEYLEIDNPE